MSYREEVQNDYFEWMVDMVCGFRYSKEISNRKLLMHLHTTVFEYTIPMDANRADDGIQLRRRYCLYHDADRSCLNIGECTVLEMMIALAIRCEEEIMDDPEMGNRTAQWFWTMIANLGLGGITDDVYDREYVDDVLKRFMDMEYEPDGRGGLFRIRNCPYDLRDVEIWRQLMWYLNTIV